ncbi:CDP-alcohol phosphatidyltransferase family protein [Candidatus Lucifugimonas marina]|uniref:CDP-alcohol phosphatidyltransferase family protein n=1 Tax=Candidatus Lucifugimonas marina TaxID=3038979 RepID=A0AAJ5ZCR2_9CHLR|nr:hypothetical protein [SAR202 cluster bacterium JH702]MDG0868268.1 hypothetical protein [SAR202 cluster bacterium JH639]WFG34912.1 hypothetical protein GKN94_04155 [SAR202 cluster bacterium JH545]WFG38863.1 hypothetical protein GKO48_04290 [SAR202 cluster bacterium JH1073]
MKIHNFVDQAYPAEKRRAELLYPGFFPVRVIAISLTPLFLAIRATPNTISLGSIFLIFVSAAFFVSGHQGWGAIALLSSLVFDAADGQVARIRGNGSAWGLQLERIQADVSYFLVLPSIAIGLVEQNLAEPVLAYLAFAGTAGYVIFRHFHKRGVNLAPNNASFLFQLALSQLKPHHDYREHNALGKYIYFIQRNMFSQLGLLYPLLVISSLIWVELLPNIVLYASIGYIAITSATLLGVLALGSRLYSHGSNGN